jgi:hypothetical protein
LVFDASSRDVFDAHALLHMDLEPERLRLGFVIYGASNRIDWRTVSAKDVEVDDPEVRAQLLPLLRAGALDAWTKSAGRLVSDCRKRLKVVLPLHGRMPLAMEPKRLSTRHVVIRDGDDYISRYSVALVGGGSLVVRMPASLRQ